MEVKEVLESKGYDFNVFLKELETVSANRLADEYPVSYNTVIYLKGKYGFPMSVARSYVGTSDYDMRKSCSLTVPKAWKDLGNSPEEFRNILYDALVRKGMPEGTGKKKDR